MRFEKKNKHIMYNKLKQGKTLKRKFISIEFFTQKNKGKINY